MFVGVPPCLGIGVRRFIESEIASLVGFWISFRRSVQSALESLVWFGPYFGPYVQGALVSFVGFGLYFVVLFKVHLSPSLGLAFILSFF
jgi:hypothetical protein